MLNMFGKHNIINKNSYGFQAGKSKKVAILHLTGIIIKKCDKKIKH